MRIAFLSLPVSGHLNPMTALARKLHRRGHDISFIGIPDGESVVRAANLKFVPFCEEEFPLGSHADRWRPLAELQGHDALRYIAKYVIPPLLKAAFDRLPVTLRAIGAEALVLDMAYRQLGLVPLYLRVPFAQICNSLHMDTSGETPACLFSWPYETTPEAISRNREGLKFLGELFGDINQIANVYAGSVGMQIDLAVPGAADSKLAIVTQAPKEFDFPSHGWPPHFHYAGPFHEDGGRAPVSFPWERLNGKPVIYASLGTVVNGLEHIHRVILAALARFPDVQLVVSVGHNVDPRKLEPIPSNAVVVQTAPQLELLKRTALCITHAGLNTVLECLAQGVPMVAIPISFDQPGVAARIRYHRTGEFVEPVDLTVAGLSELVGRVLSDPVYRQNARHFQELIARTGGLDFAAETLERAFEGELAKRRSDGNLAEPLRA